MRHGYAGLVVVALLAACGGGSHHTSDDAVQNPYVKRAKTLTEAGVSAMQRERWDYAGNVFERALKAAQLTDDLRLVANEWYNLGTAHAAAGQYQKALHDFNEAQAIAERANHPVTAIRTRLARALLPGRSGKWQTDILAVKYPADVHLLAARLAQKQKRQDVAKQEYRLVLKKDGTSRLGLLYRAQAYLGLAMTARGGRDMAGARQEVEKALGLLRLVGSPRLIAHALLFYGKLDIPINDRRESLDRALVIYQTLADIRGQRACLTELAALERSFGDMKAAQVYQLRLDYLQGGKN